MAWELRKKVKECLKTNPDKRFTGREIAEWIWDNYREDCEAKIERSTATVQPVNDEASLLTQIISEIGINYKGLMEKSPKLKTTEEHPRKYYYTEKSDEDEIAAIDIAAIDEATSDIKADTRAISANAPTKLREHDLYLLLSKYLHAELSVYSKRIDETKASNNAGRGANRWLFPDMVGVENLSADWIDEIRGHATERASKKARLWSFEVKLTINRANVREVFFQAVSNSSWAHLGYLVAAEINENCTKELRILSELHGIGVINLNAEQPSESQILLPAHERTDIDWHNANRLAAANPDFKRYIKNITNFYKTNEIKDSDWDIKS